MGHSSNISRVVFSLLAILASSAFAAQPPDVVASDAAYNTAMGAAALLNLTTGQGNTGAGWIALSSNTTGSSNTALGEEALYSNTSGGSNTASGLSALAQNISGSYNSGFGTFALTYNTTGYQNTAVGFGALADNTDGWGNTASGNGALGPNIGGVENTASGSDSLGSNTSGNFNTAIGGEAMLNNSTGSSNIAVGQGSGYNLTTGDNNIDIGNEGVAGESGAIRIGTSGYQTKAVIAGITSSKVTGSAVYVTSSGRLGVLASSERYKTAIVPMASNSEKLQRLRPVTFHLKTEPKGALQYGLIAEEVDKVYPDLVIRNDVGQIEGVRYDELASILLNEVQQQQQKLAAQTSELGDLRQQFAELKELNRTMQVALMKLQAEPSRLAMR